MAGKPLVTQASRRERRFKVLVVTLSIVVSLAIGEVALRYLTVFPISTTSNRVEDPRLGYLLSPSVPEVDSHGFRNENGAFEVMEVAAIGDSHTFGNNVRSEHAWPAVFSQLAGVNAYNFGVGGYNIFSYHALIAAALEQNPRAIIVALYPTNDFERVFKYCTNVTDFKFWRRQITELRLQAPKSAEECGVVVNDGGSDNWEWTLPDSAIVSAIDHLIVEDIKAYAMRSNALIKTAIFINNIKYNLGISQSDGVEDKFFRFPGNVPPLHKERIQKNTKSMEAAIGEMLPSFERLAASWRQAARLRGIAFGVVIIPSREQVTYALLEKTGQLGQVDPQFAELVVLQNRLEQGVRNLLYDLEIPYVAAVDDVAISMQEALEAGVNFYPAIDSHPLEAGYRAYAKAARQLWQTLGTPNSDGRSAHSN